MAEEVNYGRVALIPKGDFAGDVQYDVGDVVSYEGSSYIAKSKPPVATLPTDTEYWQLAARGFQADSAKNVTAEDEQGLGFTNVQEFINLVVGNLFGFTIDLNEIEEAFKSVFTHLDDTETLTATAMTSEDIEEAINTEWNGESSANPNAMSASDITKAISREWNGESSTDPNALTSEEISGVINT